MFGQIKMFEVQHLKLSPAQLVKHIRFPTTSSSKLWKYSARNGYLLPIIANQRLRDSGAYKSYKIECLVIFRGNKGFENLFVS